MRHPADTEDGGGRSRRRRRGPQFDAAPAPVSYTQDAAGNVFDASGVQVDPATGQPVAKPPAWAGPAVLVGVALVLVYFLR